MGTTDLPDIYAAPSGPRPSVYDKLCLAGKSESLLPIGSFPSQDSPSNQTALCSVPVDLPHFEAPLVSFFPKSNAQGVSLLSVWLAKVNQSRP